MYFLDKGLFNMSLTNLGKAKKIIEKLDNRHFDNKNGLLTGKGTVLYLQFEDIYNFAHKKPGNILDQCNEIGKLYTESLLTRTTGHKINDFKTVYRTFQSSLAAWRTEFYDYFIDRESTDRVKQINADVKKQLLQILTNNKKTTISTIINILNISDDKRKKTFIKNAKKLEGYLKEIRCLLRNADFNISDFSNADLVRSLKTALKNSSLYLPIESFPNLRRQFENNSMCISGFVGASLGSLTAMTIACIIGAPLLSTAFPVAVPAVFTVIFCLTIVALIGILGFGVGGGVGLGVAGLSFFTSLPERSTLRLLKHSCNKIKKFSYEFFETLSDIQRESINLISNQNTASKKMEEKVINDNDRDFLNKCDDFVKTIKCIWANYATAESKYYIDPGDLRKYSEEYEKNIEQIREYNEQIDDSNRHIKKCLDYKEISEKAIQYINSIKTQESKKSNKDIPEFIIENALKSFRERGLYWIWGAEEALYKYIDNMNPPQLEELQEKLENEKKDADEKVSGAEKRIEKTKEAIEQLNQKLKSSGKGPGEGGKHWSGLLYKSNKNTSSLGLAKQGLAVTFYNAYYKHKKS